MVRSRRLLRINRHTMVLLLSVVLTTGALAGCTGTDKDPESGAGDENGSGGPTKGSGGGGGSGGDSKEDGGGDGGAGGSVGRPTHPSHFRYTQDTLEVQTLSASGSFSTTGQCIPQCFLGGEYTEQVDLTGLMSLGVPAELEVDLQFDPETTGMVFGYFLSEGAIWDQEVTRATVTTDKLVAGLPGPDARLYYVVEGFLPDATEDNAWSLEVSATPLVDRIPAGFPVAFTVDDLDDPPKISGDGLGDPRLMLYAPDDTNLGEFRSSSNFTTAYDTGGTGEYVVFTPWQGSEMLTIKAQEGEPAGLRLLDIERELGEFRSPMPSAPSEWSFDIETEPLALGLFLRSEGGYMNVMSEIRLDSPETNLLTQNCGFCGGNIGGESGRMWWFHALEEGVVAGSYDVYHQDNGYPEEATEVVWRHVR